MPLRLQGRGLLNGFPLEYVSCNICGEDDHVLFMRLDSWNLVKCRGCGLVYVNPRPPQEVIEEGYRSIGDKPLGWEWQRDYLAYYELRMEADLHRSREFLRKIERYQKPGRILDVGCATGAFLRAAVERGWEAYGVEVGEWARSFAQRFELKVFIGTLEELCFPDHYFNVVFSHSLLEHLSDPKRTLLEMRRILRDEGLMVTAGVPNIDSLTIRLGLDLFSGNKPPAHLYYFNLDTIGTLLRSSGFRPLEIFTRGVPNEFFRGVLGGSAAGEKVDRLSDSLFRHGGGGSIIQRTIFRAVQLPVDLFLRAVNGGAVIETYARKQKVGVE